MGGGRAEALVRAAGLVLRRNGHVILDGVDIELAPGEIVTVIGPNGAGKTTLLKVLLGLVPPDAGRVERRPGLRIGYLPQRLPIDPALPLTVSRMLTLIRRRSRAEIAGALAETGVERLIDAPLQVLSGGELQRVLLARALLADPDLLVLDEPVQGVDFGSEAEMYELIGDLRRRHGCGVLMVSHDLHLVMAATDRVVCLHHHVCCVGTAEAVGQHPDYLRLFGARAARVLAVYPHRHDHVHALSGEVLTGTAGPVGNGAADAQSRCPHGH